MVDPAPHDDPDDLAVVERVLRGDTEAFRILVVRHEVSVFRLLRNLGPNHLTVQDLAQDTFFAAFRGLPSFDPARGRFSSWLFTIAKHQALNAKKRRVASPMEELPATTAQNTTAEDLERRQLERQLDAAVERLSDEQRTVFVLSEMVGLSMDQIAEIEHSPLPTIRSRLSRAKAALWAAIADEGPL
ncbi:MAG TPA: sigma-70 family RNA polymerase sigma factor [Polyangiaceae bacterium]